MTSDETEVLAVDAYRVMARRYVERRVAELPDPEGDGGEAYRQGLRDIHADIAGRGHPAPLDLLARVVGVPVDTLAGWLRTTDHDLT
ncbi:hypothetical protein ACFT9M_09175 [Micromonospora purpureochromogenes]|uniref:hypothetical protein n=1 Tax=Micromonospora purpureochromogenes TaxID=47872 RepID=UPI0036336FE3